MQSMKSNTCLPFSKKCSYLSQSREIEVCKIEMQVLKELMKATLGLMKMEEYIISDDLVVGKVYVIIMSMVIETKVMTAEKNKNVAMFSRFQQAMLCP